MQLLRQFQQCCATVPSSYYVLLGTRSADCVYCWTFQLYLPQLSLWSCHNWLETAQPLQWIVCIYQWKEVVWCGRSVRAPLPSFHTHHIWVHKRLPTASDVLCTADGQSLWRVIISRPRCTPHIVVYVAFIFHQYLTDPH